MENKLKIGEFSVDYVINLNKTEIRNCKTIISQIFEDKSIPIEKVHQIVNQQTGKIIRRYDKLQQVKELLEMRIKDCILEIEILEFNPLVPIDERFDPEISEITENRIKILKSNMEKLKNFLEEAGKFDSGKKKYSMVLTNPRNFPPNPILLFANTVKLCWNLLVSFDSFWADD